MQPVKDKKKRLDNLSKRKKREMRKMEQETRTAIVKLRMTPTEKEHLRFVAKSQHMSMSDYIRRVSARPPNVTKQEYDESIVRGIYEIHKIGVNINQIAKKYNENNYVTPSQELLQEMNKVYELTARMNLCIKNGG